MKMHIEFRHLRTIKAIHEHGGVARAADILNITQSALSHQIKGLEDQAGVELFVRRSKPMRLSAAGLRLLRAAERILPEIEALQNEFDGLRGGRSGRLHIAIECHACFEWLFPVLEKFRKHWPDVDVDIRPGLAFDALPALQKEEVDLVISSDPEDIPGVNSNICLIMNQSLLLHNPPIGTKRIYHSRRLSRSNPDHLSCRTHAAGYFQPATYSQ